MTRRVLCKYFARGTCLRGEYCDYSHDWRDHSNKVCIFNQKGLCNYGSRCRFSHVTVSLQGSSDATSSKSCPQVESSSQPSFPYSAFSNRESSQAFTTPEVLTASSQSLFPSYEGAQTHTLGADASINVNNHVPGGTRLADLQICSMNIDGICPNGKKCPHIHGDLCSICGTHCLHPFRPEESLEHIKVCQKNSKLLENLKYSQEIECSICLERVLSKPTEAGRKFGILSECDHPFCIECIRNWRKNTPASGIDLNTAVRACPVCRKHSYFVVPSVTWFSTNEEKQEIIDNYKEKLQYVSDFLCLKYSKFYTFFSILFFSHFPIYFIVFFGRSIDCKYFEFGNGTCPFGNICFYKHTYKPHAIRRNSNRPQRHRSRPHRPVPLVEDEDIDSEELDIIIGHLVDNDELANLAAIFGIYQEEDEPEYQDDEDLESLLATTLLLMRINSELSSDDDSYPIML
ncbi:hypothetical protein Cni_G00691 [Canna indica]|uniref:RING-type E3 ubiquitin transferase n=1 Tax=Canna indica TaxID=4628 RepID=A0AAQ3JNA0_9LILI|nr:hypothetical protein Cni_G00691 [Canna indica]